MRGTIVGIDQSGNYYLLDRILPDFITGFVLKPVSTTEHFEQTRPNYLEYVFRPYWASQENSGTLAEFAQETYRERGESGIWDLDGKEFWDDIRTEFGISPEEVPLFHTLCCGRVFTPRVQWEKVFDPDLLWAILDYQDGKTELMEAMTNGTKTDRDRLIQEQTSQHTQPSRPGIPGCATTTHDGRRHP